MDRRYFLAIALFALTVVSIALPVAAQTGRTALCRQLVFEGEAKQGFEWSALIGHPAESDGKGVAWLVRLVPVGAGSTGDVGDRNGLSRGWSLAVSPVSDQDYPDALLLASPPYGSLNSRAIATTYGMRAQDAIAWTPRHFHYFTSTADLVRARQLYRRVLDPKGPAADRQQASAALLTLSTDPKSIATGRLDVLDAHLITGTADPAPFASQWAATLGSIPHTLDADGGKPSSMGQLHSLKFKITLWLPASWKAPAGNGIAQVNCAE